MDSRLAGKYSGQLEKRSRDRGLFAPLRSLTDVHHTGNTWKQREFRLDGQQLSYWQGRTKKGEVCIKDVGVRKLASDEANGKEFGFELTLPEGVPANEKLYLCADSATTRAKWIQVLNTAAKNKEWEIKFQSLMKKTGESIAKALVQRPLDDREALVILHLKQRAQFRRFSDDRHAAEAELQRLRAQGEAAASAASGKGGNKSNSNSNSSRLIKEQEERLANLTRVYSASIIQALFRRFLVLRRVRRRRRERQMVALIEKCVRRFLDRRIELRRLRKEHAAHKIGSLLIWRLYKLRSFLRLCRSAPVVLVEGVAGENIKFEEASASHLFFFYVMACHDTNTDPNTHFNGKDETRVEHGYGLRSSSISRSGGIPFNTTPSWKGEQGVAVGVCEDSFLVVTLVTSQKPGAQEVFHGQAVVRLSEHSQLFDGNGAAVPVHCNIQKYVAPLETPAGSSVLSLNQAMHRKVEGRLSLNLRVPRHTHTMAGWLYKESGRLLSHEFKRRYFVLLEGALYYSHSDAELGSVKNMLLCRDVTALSREHSQGRDCLRIHFTQLASGKKGSWLVHFPPEQRQEIRVWREWVRKIHRSCAQLGGELLASSANHTNNKRRVKGQKSSNELLWASV